MTFGEFVIRFRSIDRSREREREGGDRERWKEREGEKGREGERGRERERVRESENNCKYMDGFAVYVVRTCECPCRRVFVITIFSK